MTQRIIPITSANFIAGRTPDQPLDLQAIFGNNQPLALEIGCGTGHFVLERARKQPGTNFLAIDIYNKGCLKTCKKIDEAGVQNVRVMRVEARWLLDKGSLAQKTPLEQTTGQPRISPQPGSASATRR
jgi:tRNA (guanine-N7-)-methyltransferase